MGLRLWQRRRELVCRECARDAFASLGLTFCFALWLICRVSIAMDCFKHVVQILPDSAEAWGNLGALHGRAGNYKEAIGAMEEAAKLRCVHPPLFSKLATWGMLDLKKRHSG